jgi:hypothetical protein
MTPLCGVKSFPREARGTADPSASLGMTKGKVALPWRAVTGQKAILGKALHPSHEDVILSGAPRRFIAQRGTADPSASLGMTKGKVALPWRVVYCTKGDLWKTSSPHARRRHPERSAAQIYRTRDSLWRVVEGPRRFLLADVLPSFPATKLRGLFCQGPA